MNPISCPQEARVARAARTGCWDGFVRAHALECAFCREVAAIAGWLGNLAEGSQSALPNAEQVWLNTRLRAMESKKERALRPLIVAEFVARVASALALAGGIAWIWLRAPSWAKPFPAGGLTFATPALLSAAALLTCAVVFLFLRLHQSILAEE
jgi:hypothetical protein